MTKFQYPRLYTLQDIPEFQQFLQENPQNTDNIDAGFASWMYTKPIHWLAILEIICPDFDKIDRWHSESIYELVNSGPGHSDFPEEFWKQLKYSLRALWTLQLENLYPDGEWAVREVEDHGHIELEIIRRSKENDEKDTHTFHTEKETIHGTVENFGSWVINDLYEQITEKMLAFFNDEAYLKAKTDRPVLASISELIKLSIGYIFSLIEANTEFDLMIKTSDGFLSVGEATSIIGAEFYGQKNWLTSCVEKQYSTLLIDEYMAQLEKWLDQPRKTPHLSKLEILDIKKRHRRGGKEFSKHAKQDVSLLLNEIERLNQLLENN